MTAELSGVGVQALRHYERLGLLTPERTDGGTRRYSDRDLARLERISELIDAGVNLVGVRHILALEARNVDLETDNARLRGESGGEGGAGDDGTGRRV
nr:MerR family transcriptional regulator [Rhodococcus triatomae]